jgi:hypothetical protein
MRRPLVSLLGSAALLGAAPARAEPATDGYCQHVTGVADAQRALLVAPEVFASLGYLDQPATIDVPDATANDVRFTLGVRVRLGGVYQGLVTRQRADAECRRQRALAQVRGETTAAALAARAQILDEALGEARAILAQADADLADRRATAQEVTATRLRVDELRALAAATHRELDALPPAAAPRPRALARYYDADAEVERHEARLRSAQAWDVSVRFGYDRFLAADDESPYFAVVSASFNLGWFLQARAHERAAAGRRRLVQQEGGREAHVAEARLRALLEAERRRHADTSVLVADLERQLGQLRKLGGDSSRRYRQTVWFEWVKLRADHAYLAAHVASLQAILGEAGE